MTILIIMAALICALTLLSWVWCHHNSILWEPRQSSAIIFLICATFLIAVGIERFVL